MKPFLCAFIPLTLLLFFVGFWGARQAFVLPDSGPPDDIIREVESGTRVCEILIAPAAWSGPACLFVGPALWALLPSIAFSFAWRRLLPRHSRRRAYV